MGVGTIVCTEDWEGDLVRIPPVGTLMVGHLVFLGFLVRMPLVGTGMVGSPLELVGDIV